MGCQETPFPPPSQVSHSICPRRDGNVSREGSPNYVNFVVLSLSGEKDSDLSWVLPTFTPSSNCPKPLFKSRGHRNKEGFRRSYPECVDCINVKHRDLRS